MTYVTSCKICGKNYTKFSLLSKDERCQECSRNSRRNRYAQRKKLIEMNKDDVMETIENMEKDIEILKIAIEAQENEINIVVSDIEHRALALLDEAVENEVKRLFDEEIALAKSLEEKFKMSLIAVQSNMNKAYKKISVRVTYIEDMLKKMGDK